MEKVTETIINSCFDGSIYQKYYKNDRGELYGLCVNYHDNGSIMASTNYANDIKNGLSEEFWENGNIKYRCNYVNGMIYGLEEKYPEDEVIN